MRVEPPVEAFERFPGRRVHGRAAQGQPAGPHLRATIAAHAQTVAHGALHAGFVVRAAAPDDGGGRPVRRLCVAAARPWLCASRATARRPGQTSPPSPRTYGPHPTAGSSQWGNARRSPTRSCPPCWQAPRRACRLFCEPLASGGQATESPPTFNHPANIGTLTSAPNPMSARVLWVCFQPLFTENCCAENYAAAGKVSLAPERG